MNAVCQRVSRPASPRLPAASSFSLNNADDLGDPAGQSLRSSRRQPCRQIFNSHQRPMADRFSVDHFKPMRLTPYAVAQACGVPRTRIERLTREATPVTADTALRLARYFGTTVSFWMGVQTQYDLERAQDELTSELKRLPPGEQR